MIFKIVEKYDSGQLLHFIDNYSPNNRAAFDQTTNGTKTFSATFAGLYIYDPEQVKMLLEYYEHEHANHLQSYIADKNNRSYFDALTIAATKWKEVLDPLLKELDLPNFEEVDLKDLDFATQQGTFFIIKE